MRESSLLQGFVFIVLFLLSLPICCFVLMIAFLTAFGSFEPVFADYRLIFAGIFVISIVSIAFLLRYMVFAYQGIWREEPKEKHKHS